MAGSEQLRDNRRMTDEQTLREDLAVTGCAGLSVSIPLLEVNRQCRGGAGPSEFDPQKTFRAAKKYCIL